MHARQRGAFYDLLSALRALGDRDVIDRALDFLAELFWSKDGSGQVIPDEDVLAIAEQLAIDLAAAWKKEAAGELTERWLNLRNKDALVEMARTFDRKFLELEPSSPKSEYVATLLKEARLQKPPAELLKPKKPKER